MHAGYNYLILNIDFKHSRVIFSFLYKNNKKLWPHRQGGEGICSIVFIEFSLLLVHQRLPNAVISHRNHPPPPIASTSAVPRPNPVKTAILILCLDKILANRSWLSPRKRQEKLDHSKTHRRLLSHKERWGPALSPRPRARALVCLALLSTRG